MTIEQLKQMEGFEEMMKSDAKTIVFVGDPSTGLQIQEHIRILKELENKEVPIVIVQSKENEEDETKLLKDLVDFAEITRPSFPIINLIGYVDYYPSVDKCSSYKHQNSFKHNISKRRRK